MAGSIDTGALLSARTPAISELNASTRCGDRKDDDLILEPPSTRTISGAQSIWARQRRSEAWPLRAPTVGLETQTRDRRRVHRKNTLVGSTTVVIDGEWLAYLQNPRADMNAETPHPDSRATHTLRTRLAPMSLHKAVVMPLTARLILIIRCTPLGAMNVHETRRDQEAL